MEEKFDLWQKEKESYEKLKEARYRQKKAKIALQRAYEKKEECSKKVDLYREIVKHEKEILKFNLSKNQVFWDYYEQVRSKNDPLIEKMRAEASQEHFKAQRLIKSVNRLNSNRGKDDLELVKHHEQRRDELNEQVKNLKNEIKEAKRVAKEADSKIDRSACKDAEIHLKKADSEYREAIRDLEEKKRQKSICDKEKDEAETRYKRIKKELQEFIDFLQSDNHKSS